MGIFAAQLRYADGMTGIRVHTGGGSKKPFGEGRGETGGQRREEPGL